MGRSGLRRICRVCRSVAVGLRVRRIASVAILLRWSVLLVLSVLPLLALLQLPCRIRLLPVEYLAVHCHRLRQLALHLRQHLCESDMHIKVSHCHSRCFVVFSSALRCSLPPSAYAWLASTCACGKRRKSRSPYAAI